jgi:hypothetical protein
LTPALALNAVAVASTADPLAARVPDAVSDRFSASDAAAAGSEGSAIVLAALPRSRYAEGGPAARPVPPSVPHVSAVDSPLTY